MRFQAPACLIVSTIPYESSSPLCSLPEKLRCRLFIIWGMVRGSIPVALLQAFLILICGVWFMSKIVGIGCLIAKHASGMALLTSQVPNVTKVVLPGLIPFESVHSWKSSRISGSSGLESTFSCVMPVRVVQKADKIGHMVGLT